MDDFEMITLKPGRGGREVLCDSCGADWTERTESGGLLFQSKAICPECSASWEEGARRYGETNLIGGTCPAGKSFADWVREDLR